MNNLYRTGAARTSGLALVALLFIFSASLRAQCPTFSKVTLRLPVRSGPAAIVIGDFRGVGKMDLAIANGGLLLPNNVAIFLGHGDGTFDNPVFYNLVGRNASSLAMADFNGDMIPDLVVTNEASNTVSVLIGRGDGTFVMPPQDYNTAPGPHYVTVGDFNNDGAPDLAVANDSSNTLSILLNNGDGTFGPANNIPGGPNPHSITSGAFHGDNNLDLAVANITASQISIYRGNGFGAFTPFSTIPVGSFPHHVLAKDLRRSNILDLVSADSQEALVSVLFGVGDGNFYVNSQSAVGEGPLHVESDDFNGDNIPDLAVASNLTNNTKNIAILIGRGDGTFNNACYYTAETETKALAIGDLDGDGKPDIAAVNVAADSVTLLLSRPRGLCDEGCDGKK